MIVCVNPEESSLSETLNTLKFAEKTKNLSDKPTDLNGVELGTLDDPFNTMVYFSKFLSGNFYKMFCFF